MYLIERMFIPFCLMPIIILELVVIIYVYGPFKFTEDIFHTMGFQPGLFYIILWCVLPVLLFVSYDILLNIIEMGLFWASIRKYLCFDSCIIKDERNFKILYNTAQSIPIDYINYKKY